MKLVRDFFAIAVGLALALGGALYLSEQDSLAAPDGGTVGNGTPASCTEAALDAKLAGGGSVTFACGANPYTITLTSQIIVTSSTSVDGGGKVTLSGGHTTKVFLVSGGTGLTLTNITIADGRSSIGGCITAAVGALSILQSTLRDCHSTSGALFGGVGGALFVYGANLSMSNSQVLNNQADQHGGGIYLNGGAHLLDHVSIVGNRADITYTNSGGGIYVENDAVLTIQNSQIDRNQMGYQGHGGGIAALTSTLQLANVSLSYNHGENAGLGGGLYLQDATANLDGVRITGNDKVGDGGGIESNESNLSVSNSTLGDNVTYGDGGGIRALYGVLNLSHVVVNDNLVGEDGGGLSLYDTRTTVAESTIGGNQAARSGGGINQYRNTLVLNDVSVDGNSTIGNAADGGGINSDTSISGILLVSNSTLSNNLTSNHGGGIFNSSGSTSILTNTTLSANIAITGGALYNEMSFASGRTFITLTNVTVKDNRATAGGGIFNENGAFNFIYVKNTAIADSPSGGNCKGKALTGSIYSLSSDTSCALAGTGDLNNTPAQLLALAFVGGPTKTYLPKATSALINAVAGSDCPLSDQRGVARPQGGNCDIGAVERQASDPSVVPMLYIPLVVR